MLCKLKAHVCDYKIMGVKEMGLKHGFKTWQWKRIVTKRKR